MKRLHMIFMIVIIVLSSVLAYRYTILHKLDRMTITNRLAADSECDSEKITRLMDTFVQDYNQGHITTTSDYFNQYFQWFSDTEVVNGEKVDHFVTYASHTELLTHFQAQFHLGQTLQITSLHINGGGWHGGADIVYQGVSETSDGRGVLIGKGMVDCQSHKIAVWSMATHYPKMMPAP